MNCYMKAEANFPKPLCVLPAHLHVAVSSVLCEGWLLGDALLMNFVIPSSAGEILGEG